MTKKDVAIIGGTFDPIHNGHIAMAKYLSDNYIVDEVWMLPSYSSPHKNSESISSFEDRINMLNIAFEDDFRIKIVPFEKDYYFQMKENGDGEIKTYTSDILKAIIKKYVNLRIHFILGFDSIKNITTWNDYKYLLKNYWFYIFDREDSEFKTLNDKKNYLQELKNKTNINFYYEFMDTKIPDVSSTLLKQLLKNEVLNKEKILNLMPEKVYKYIIDKNLYK